jgi:hypothetical protein
MQYVGKKFRLKICILTYKKEKIGNKTSHFPFFTAQTLSFSVA